MSQMIVKCKYRMKGMIKNLNKLLTYKQITRVGINQL